MLSLEDCIALCGASEEEVLAITRHEHIPEIAAAEFMSYLLSTPGGEIRIKTMLRDDIAFAIARRDEARERSLKSLLRNFVLQHPRCEERRQQAPDCPRRRSEDAAI